MASVPGLGVVRGMAITFKHFVETFIADLDRFPNRYRDDAQAVRQHPSERGVFTIQYPEEKLEIPERFRQIPFLPYDADTGDVRCTACGICAKVCPPQCIWIVQAEDPDSGRRMPKAQEFYIDASICMSCGFCAEYCPFDAIKMNHEFEISSYERHEEWVYDIDDLLLSTEYYAETHPRAWAEEEKERAKKEAARRGR